MMKLLDGIRVAASEAFGQTAQRQTITTSENSAANASLWSCIPSEKQAAEAFAQINARLAVAQQQMLSPNPIPQPHPTPAPQGRPVALAKEVPQISALQEVAPAQDGSSYKPVTKEQVRQIMSYHWNPERIKNPAKSEQKEKLFEDYTNRLNETMRQFGINTPLKQAAFLATVAEESIELTAMEELGKPAKHGGYHGRGIIQLTHKEGYAEASEALKVGEPTGKPPKHRGLVDKPELVAEPKHAFNTGGWFWAQKKTGRFAESPNDLMGDQPHAALQDFRQAAGLVNGGQKDGYMNHWGKRVEYYKRALNALEIPVSKELDEAMTQVMKDYTGKNHQLPPEPSFRQWRSEQQAERAQRKAGRRD